MRVVIGTRSGPPEVLRIDLPMLSGYPTCHDRCRLV